MKLMGTFSCRTRAWSCPSACSSRPVNASPPDREQPFWVSTASTGELLAAHRLGQPEKLQRRGLPAQSGQIPQQAPEDLPPIRPVSVPNTSTWGRAVTSGTIKPR